MIEIIGYWINFATGFTLLVTSVYAFYLFSGTPSRATEKASQYLSFGILLSLVSLGSNTLYWQVFGQVSLYYEVIELSTLRLLGFYLDIVFKGLGILGAYCAIIAFKLMHK